jgi:zinc transport system permease protein
MINAFFSHSFLMMALLAGVTASITGGIVGSYIVVKRIVFISGSIAHSVLGGMGLFLWLKRTYHLEFISPLQGALGAALLSAALIGWIHLKFKEREDTIIAAIWSTGMAIGMIFISLTPGYNVELLNFLFGNIMWVSWDDLYMLIGLNAVVIVVTSFCHQKFLAICFDEDQAALQGINVKGYYLLLLSLVAISVVIMIQAVGAILIIAMLAIPPAIAGCFTSRLNRMMCLAILLGSFFTIIGLFTAFQLNWPPGATISLISASFYALTLLKKFTKRL